MPSPRSASGRVVEFVPFNGISGHDEATKRRIRSKATRYSVERPDRKLLRDGRQTRSLIDTTGDAQSTRSETFAPLPVVDHHATYSANPHRSMPGAMSPRQFEPPPLTTIPWAIPVFNFYIKVTIPGYLARITESAEESDVCIQWIIRECFDEPTYVLVMVLCTVQRVIMFDDQTEGRMTLLRNMILHHLHQGLDDPDRRRSNGLLFAIATMAAYERLCGDAMAAASIHLSGLAQIVESRGGLEQLGLPPPVLRILQWLDEKARYGYSLDSAMAHASSGTVHSGEGLDGRIDIRLE